MVRSTLSAAVLLAAVAGLTGCTTTDARYVTTPANGVAVVTVPDSDLIPWYYRHEALQYIRENNPSFKESDIIKKGYVPAGTSIVGPDGMPAPIRANVNGEKEYQIAFRQTTTRIAVGPAPTTTMPGMLPNNGMPTSTGMPNTVVPTGGMTSTQYPGAYSGMPTTNPAPYTGVQNVNPPPSQMQPNSQMMPPLYTPPTNPTSGPGLNGRY
jgi:hypothetical protein